MRSLWKPSLMLSCGILMLMAPALCLGAEPDTYVKILALQKYRQPPNLADIWQVEVAVGNIGTVAPGAYAVATLTVSADGKPTCSTGISGIQLPPQQSRKAFKFQVTYPGLTAQYSAGAPKKKTKKGGPGTLPPASLGVRYTIEAEVKYLNCSTSQFETNTGNNLQSVTIPFPPGGTPQCAKLQ